MFNREIPFSVCVISRTFVTDLQYVGAADDGFCSVEDMDNIVNYLHKHHFDFRGLIPKGLAIKVTEKNNPYKLDCLWRHAVFVHIAILI